MYRIKYLHPSTRIKKYGTKINNNNNNHNNNRKDSCSFSSFVLDSPVSQLNVRPSLLKTNSTNSTKSTKTTNSTNSKRNNIVKNKLSLSAYCKPETAVRLTSAPRHKHLEDDYELDQVIGHGASSTVRLAINRSSGVKVAIKCIAKHDVLRRWHRPERRFLEEYEILLTLRDSHPNIVNLLDVYETESEVQLVLEYCSGGELFALIQDRGTSHPRKRRRSTNNVNANVNANANANSTPELINVNVNVNVNINDDPSGFSEPQVAGILSQLLSTLAHLHKRGIVHRDVKPENILISSSDHHRNIQDDPIIQVKLSDFGLARILHSSNCTGGYDSSASHSSSGEPLTPPCLKRSRAYSRVGSDYYTAPEVSTGNGYDTAVDIYSLGVTLYILLSGHPPSHKTYASQSILDAYSSASDYTDDEDTEEAHTMVEFPPTHWSHISSSAKNLLKKMLHPNPLERITAKQALQHQWILRQICFHSLTLSSNTTVFNPLPFVSTFDPMLNYNYLATRLFPNNNTNKRRRRSHSILSTKDISTFPTMPCPQNIITPISQPTI